MMTTLPDAADAGTIQPLRAEDLDAVIALDTAIGGLSRRGFFERRLSAALEQPRDYVYVGLHLNGQLAGFAMARLVEGAFGKPGARAVLDAITVARAHQSHGAGHKLLNAVRDILTHKGVSELESQVDWADRALLGFLGDTGFTLAPRIVLSRKTDHLAVTNGDDPEAEDEELETDFSSPEGDEAGALSTDRIPVRSMTETDLDAIIRIDRKLSGDDRTAYFERLRREAFHASGVRVSLVAEIDGFVVGFVMARVDYGEFGHTIPEAVLDAVGVNPDFQGQGVGTALVSQLTSNLTILQVEHLGTEVAWNDVSNIAFFATSSFRPSQRIALACVL